MEAAEHDGGEGEGEGEGEGKGLAALVKQGNPNYTGYGLKRRQFVMRGTTP